MTHEDEGNYAGKREGHLLNEKIAAQIKEKREENKISCAAAHQIAQELNVSPAEVGAAIDLLELKISRCQLGLFGYGKDKKILQDIRRPQDPQIEKAINEKTVNGRITCADAWEIAKQFRIPKPAVAVICEEMKIKISSCQLGTFR